jgi:hypothetical protein
MTKCPGRKDRGFVFRNTRAANAGTKGKTTMQTNTVFGRQRQPTPHAAITTTDDDDIGCTVQPIPIRDLVLIGQEAWSRLANSQSWKDWTLVGDALLAGRAEALRSAHTNKPEGRRYNEEFGDWLRANKFDVIDKSTRSRLFECLAHRNEIEPWRATLTTFQRLELNHPAVVLRRWKKTIVKKPDDAKPKLSPIAKLRKSVFTLDEENARLKRELGLGAPFTPNDKPTDQAAVVFRILHCSPSAARALSRALNKLARAAEANAPQTINEVQA